MKKPSNDQLNTAINWLRLYEEHGSTNNEACNVVADWLEREIEKRKLKAFAAANNVTVGQMRRIAKTKGIKLP